MKTSLASPIRAVLLAVLACAALACSGGPRTSQHQQPGGGPAPGTVTGDTGGAGDEPGGTTGDEPGDADLPGRGETCADAGPACAPGLTCVRYHGIAGTAGPEFRSCETPCPKDPTACPAGTSCVTIVDGPGAVCR